MDRVIVGTKGWSGWPEFAGSTWVPMQYVLGFRKLGLECVWVDHLGPIDPVEDAHSLDYLMDRFDWTARQFGFGDGYCVVYCGGERYFGMTERQFQGFVPETDLLISISGSLPLTSPLMRIPRRAYIDVDPGFTQMWALECDMGFDRHNFFFTVGQNVGRAEFKVPTRGIEWQPILPPVVLDLWPAHIDEKYQRFSTVTDWWGSQYATFEGQLYGGKRDEFLRFLRVPAETKQRIELALSIYQHDYEDIGLLTAHDWCVRNPYAYAGDPLSYREFIQFSRAELGIAKSGYVKSNSGWVSDRTACYLASGKPALVQSTGFEWRLPTGKGLLTFHTLDEAVAGIGAINEDYLVHCHAARQIAEQYLGSDVVLGSILAKVGL